MLEADSISLGKGHFKMFALCFDLFIDLNNNISALRVGILFFWLVNGFLVMNDNWVWQACGVCL